MACKHYGPLNGHSKILAQALRENCVSFVLPRVNHMRKVPTAMSHPCKRHLMALAMAALAGAASAADFDISAQPLDSALAQLARQAGLQLMAPPALVQGRPGAAVKGSMSAQDAVRQLLRNTNLVARIEGTTLVIDNGQTAGEVALNPVVVTAPATRAGDRPEAYAGGKQARGSRIGMLGDQDVMDTPFSTVAYTAEAVADQQARTLGEVLANDASVRLTTASQGFSEDIQVRGFGISGGDVGLNGLYGLTSASRVPAEILERAELLKGPGAMVGGMPPGGSIGGAINVQTKRAGDAPLNRVGLQYLGRAQFGTSVDISRRFGENKEWGVRVNGAARGGEASIRGGDQKLGVGAIAVDYRGSNLRWSLDAYAQREEMEDFRPQIGFNPALTSLPKPPNARSNWFPDTDLSLDDKVIASRLEVDLNDQVTAFAGIGYRKGKAQQIFPTTTTSMNAAGDFTVRSSFYDSYTETSSADLGLRAKFATAGIKHSLVVSASDLRQESGNAYVAGLTTSPSNIYHPAPLPPVEGARTAPNKASKAHNYGIAVTDTLALADDRLLLTLGLRRQTVDLRNFSTATGAQTSSYAKSATTPLVGLVVKANDQVSVYGNYTAGLSRGGTAPNTAVNAGEVFPPFKSKQYEAGVKVDWGSVMTTASLFQISRPNSMTDPATNIYSFDGEQRNRGLELAAYGELQRGLRWMGGLAFNRAKVTKAAQYQGNDAYGVPKINANLGADWDVPGVQGLSVNGRVIRTGSAWASNANTLKLSGWTRLDVGARYRTQVSGKAVVLRANVENLTGKNVWLISGNNYLTLSAPRTVVLSATVDF